nr:uncharacterized protein LOC113393110 [Vanessa tameamea]
MDKYLRPDRLDIDPSNSSAAKHWEHWKRTFESFLSASDFSHMSEKVLTSYKKLDLLINHVSSNIYTYISECSTYETAIAILDKIFIKPKNIIFARHALATRKQQIEESIDNYLQALKQLAKDCDFKNVDAETNRNDNIRDAFISGIQSNKIRQRLLENLDLSLDDVYNQALSLEGAEISSQQYNISVNAIENNKSRDNSMFVRPQSSEYDSRKSSSEATNYKRKCFFCGDRIHIRKNCPALDVTCQMCGKKGHFANVCRSKICNNAATIKQFESSACIVAASPSSLKKATLPAYIKGIRAHALIDTGSSVSFINDNFFKLCGLKKLPSNQTISMASTNFTSLVDGKTIVSAKIGNHDYDDLNLLIVKNLCADLIIGHDILEKHSFLEFSFGGPKEPIIVCNVAEASIPAVPLFANISADCKPIAIKSRRFSQDDKQFIIQEIRKLLAEGIIEESSSPWRAQVLITKNENHKKRLVIDYSQTINKYTQLDAYPLPNIEEMISQVSKYFFFSTIDLQNAYHQIPILAKEKQYTAFEADGNLYQFRRIPFGVTNGVSSFQRIIDWVLKEEKLKDTFAYLDDITVCGKTLTEHNENLENFLAAARKYCLTINKDKSKFSQTTINILGYNIKDQVIRPDADRLRPLTSLPPPNDLPSQRRIVGMFAHYSRWIPNFSERIHAISHNKIFPFSEELVQRFQSLKSDIIKSAVYAIDYSLPLTVETDASDHSIAAVLSQDGRPVAFFSKTLNLTEQNHSAIEKEAYAIVEALKKWKHYLIAQVQHTKLISLHEALCHPGVTRMAHWIKTKNLPYTIEEIRNMIKSCRVCSEIKPNYVRNPIPRLNLIKATAPFERLSLDFKGPIPSNTKNKYILTIIDEFSRFPFAFPCADITSKTVIKYLNEIFLTFGMPSFIHSDRGTAFMSSDLKEFLYNRGIATSRTTPYNPRGNGQVERLNATLWKAVQLAIRSKNMSIENWELALPQALHSIRSLLCTATNCTPHERMFTHTRKSANGVSVPSWLINSEHALMRKCNRTNKYQPLVEEVELIHVNPDYSHIRLSDGRETTVSNRNLAPLGQSQREFDVLSENEVPIDEEQNSPREDNTSDSNYESTEELPPEGNRSNSMEEEATLRRSNREHRLPTRLQDYVLN